MPNTTPVRERLLDASISVLMGKGLRHFSQHKVAREANVPQGHSSHYFPKRTGLVVATAERFLAMLAQEPVQLLADLPTTRGLLALLIESDGNEDITASTKRCLDLLRQRTAASIGVNSESPEARLAMAMFLGLSIQQFLERRPGKEMVVLVEKAQAMLQRLSAKGTSRKPLEKAEPLEGSLP